MASITHTQVRDVGANGARVTDTITAATRGLPVELFVFVAETDAFSHVAKPSDISAHPSVKTAGFAFYRLAACNRTFDTISAAQSFATALQQRLRALAVEWDSVSTFVGSTTETLSSGIP